MHDRMRLADLLGHDAVDEVGRSLGRVHDVRMRRDGPVLQPSNQPTYRLLGLVIGRGAVGRRLGYSDPDINGPWLLKAIFQAQTRRSRYVEWARVAGVVKGRVIVRGDGSDLPPVPPQEDQEGTP